MLAANGTLGAGAFAGDRIEGGTEGNAAGGIPVSPITCTALTAWSTFGLGAGLWAEGRIDSITIRISSALSVVRVRTETRCSHAGCGAIF